jgi:hypothetical protein
MGAVLRGKDWSKTKFGPMDKWPPSLVSMVSLVMSSSTPMALWWGKEHLVIYNDTYIPVAGKRHPSCFGAAAKEYWGDEWERLAPVFARVMKGESIATEDSCIIVDNKGSQEVFPFHIQVLMRRRRTSHGTF